MLLFAVAVSITIAGCSKDDDNRVSYTISGNANGAQMVPSVSGNGTATMTGTYDPNTRIMTYTTNWVGMSGAPTSGGFFTGASGAVGTAITPGWTIGTDWTGTGTASGSVVLTADQASQLTSGNMYYSIGTATNAGGEVRGQLTATRN